MEVKATTDSLKAERVKRREAESRLTTLDDEIVELKETVASLTKVGSFSYNLKPYFVWNLWKYHHDNKAIEGSASFD